MRIDYLSFGKFCCLIYTFNQDQLVPYIHHYLPERPYYFRIKLRVSELQGFIQQLSPPKKCEKRNDCYTFSLQTSLSPFHKVVSYERDHYSFCKEMYSSKLLVKIRFQKNDHLQFRVTKLKRFSLGKLYVLTPLLVIKVPNVSCVFCFVLKRFCLTFKVVQVHECIGYVILYLFASYICYLIVNCACNFIYFHGYICLFMFVFVSFCYIIKVNTHLLKFLSL